MKYFKFVCYSLLLMLLFNTSSLYAAPPLEDHTLHTPLSLMPEPLSGSRDTLKLAATWWLPDWQGGQGTRGSTDDGGGDIDGECETYGFVTECAPPKVSGGIVHPISGLTCHKSCSCPTEYKYYYANCNGYRRPAGDSCMAWIELYNQCVCFPNFRYNDSNCNEEFYPTGAFCVDDSGLKFEGCVIRPECTVSSKECIYGCKTYNTCDRCIECKTNPDCDVAGKSCGSLGCKEYNSCSKCITCNTDPCSGVTCGSHASCSNGKCVCDSGYKMCNGSCISTSECCGGCSSNQTCQNGSCVTNTPSCSDTCPSYTKSSSSSCTYGATSCYDTCYGKTWYKCNDAPSDPCSGVSCGSNAYCSGGSCYCNSGYTGNANSGCTKVDTCVSGGSSSCSGQTSSCSSSQVQTSSCKDCSGTMHYSCRAKTCAEQGKKDCNGSCISTSECCGGCSAGQTCSNGTCESSCVSGGSRTCTGQTTSCSSSQVQTSSCKDCSGTTHYSCSDKTCSVAGSYNGTSCSAFSNLLPRECGLKYQEMGSDCSSSGKPIGLNKGECDVDSWRGCCEQCKGGS